MAKPDLKMLKRPAPNAASVAEDQEPMATEKPAKEIPAWQVGKRAVTVWINEEQYRRLNDVHFEQRKPVRRLVFEAINMLLPEYDKLPVPESKND